MISIDVCPICVKHPLEDQQSIHQVHWTQCAKCNQWFHNICIGMTQEIENNTHSYHCLKCSRKHGKSIMKRKSKRAKNQIDYVALNSGDSFAIDKTMHPHVPRFINFATTGNDGDNHDENDANRYIVVTDRLSQDMVFHNRNQKPIYLPQVDLNLVGMKLPLEKLKITIDYITNKVGSDTPVVVMDVLTQQGVNPAWNMGKWQQYFNSDETSRDRLRNVITLEISKVDDLGREFVRPEYVSQLDLVDKVWNQDDEQERPAITKYCLMSVKNSFTDFHIDFGGTSVYYTVCSGEKTFLMYPPSVENLHLYQSWCLEPQQNYIWFGNYSTTLNRKRICPTGGFKVTLYPGDLFIIPSGWIHAVYTPQDSIVIGGNYITLNDMEMQLKIVELEKLTKVPAKFRFPMFNKVLWYTSWYYFNHKSEFQQDLNNDCKKMKHILSILINQLKSHYELSKTNQTAKRSIPTNLIGRDVIGYIIELESWAKTISDDKCKNSGPVL